MSSLNNSFSSGLFLTTAEGDQLENIDSVTVNNTQWGYLGAADQGFSTSTSPTYSGLTISGGNLIADAQDISTDTTTGTKIGTSSSQKLGFFGGTPATQQTAAGTLTDNSSGSVDGTIASVSNTGDDSTINNNLADLVDRINSLENTLSNLSLQA